MEYQSSAAVKFHPIFYAQFKCNDCHQYQNFLYLHCFLTTSLNSVRLSLRTVFIVSEAFPCSTKVTAFPTSGGVSHIRAIAPIMMRFRKQRTPSISTNTPQYNVTLTVCVLSSYKLQERNVTSWTGSHPCNSKVSGLCSALTKLQLSAVTACTSVRRANYSSPSKECGYSRQFALNLYNSQILNNTVFHRKALRIAPSPNMFCFK